MTAIAPQVAQQATAAARPAAENLAQMLQQTGLLGSGADPRVVARNILSSLKTHGYGGKHPGQELGAQLRQALVALQRGNGLKATGKLDKATMAILRNIGALGDPRMAKGVLAVRDGFERVGGAPKTAAQTQAEQASLLMSLANLLQTRFGGSGKAMGEWLARLSEGLSKMGESVRETVGNLVSRAGGGAAETAATTTAAAQARSDGNPTAVAAHALTAAKAEAKEKARVHAPTARKVARSRGLTEGNDDEGVSDEEGGRGLLGGGDGQEGAASDDENGDGAAAAGKGEGEERFTGNAPSGDEKFADDRRGDATMDDGSDDEAGTYEVPRLSEQIQDALFTIVRDPDKGNKATSYTWDVTFFKAGIYGAKQKAEEVLHLQVKNATAFDPVWERTVTALNNYLKRFDPKGEQVTIEDIKLALRRARVHE